MRNLDAVVLLTLFCCACGGCGPRPPVNTPPLAASFENPGGMWLPEQLVAHADTLASLGLELRPEQLADPAQPPLAAVIWLGSCTASFVSPQGLIATNHHCVQGGLQYNATPENAFATKGFYAPTMGDELSVGPTGRVYVATAFSDVTDDIVARLAEAGDDEGRFAALEARRKELVAACEAGRPQLRCRTASYYEGTRHVLIEQLAIRDVRLVFVPPESVGNYGDEIDNWMWPRHTGDFAFMRAYVGADGQPADYAPTNVPYQPAHYLPVGAGVREGDLVMVAGYPKATHRLETAGEMVYAMQWEMPKGIERLDAYLTELAKVAALDEQAALQAHTYQMWFGNVLKKYHGTLEGVALGGLQARKDAAEAAFRAWIAADTERAAVGQALDAMDALLEQRVATRDHDAALDEIVGYSTLMETAMTIVRMAEERAKPDAERDPAFQERTWRDIEQRFATAERRYDRRVDRVLLGLALRRAARLPVEQRPKALAVLVGADLSEAGIERALDGLYGATELEDLDTRLGLLRASTAQSLADVRDPFVQAARAIWPQVADSERRAKTLAGAMIAVRPRYAEGLLAFSEAPLASDANRTLRVTYGTVRGYRPTPEAASYHPFTTVDEMVAKHTGEAPFDAPAPLLEAVAGGRLGSYADTSGGELVVDFLSDVDTSNGNSGSPTINGRGEWVGLLFDGTYESMAKDWLYQPETTRSIHADIRYILWVTDTLGADRVLEELGVRPSVE